MDDPHQRHDGPAGLHTLSEVRQISFKKTNGVLTVLAVLWPTAAGVIAINMASGVYLLYRDSICSMRAGPRGFGLAGRQRGPFFSWTAFLSDLTTKVLRLSFSESARTAKALCISGPVRKMKRPE